MREPIRIKVNKDGQVWIVFNADEGRGAMLNLNNIVLGMQDGGINRGICIDAIAAALKGAGKDE